MDSREIRRIRDQFRADQWPQFLEMVEISGLRGFERQAVRFDFPVVAVVGENGSGKSTVLKAAACAYENAAPGGSTYYPSTFFISTHWDDIEDVTLRFRVRRGARDDEFRIRKPSQRWSYPEDRIKRAVYIQDISRTLPLDATVGYAKIAKRAAGEAGAEAVPDEYVVALSRVLSRDYADARFARPDVDSDKEVGILTRDFGEVSQFHQGAGEDATLDLFRLFQQVPDYSLVIIDELEASLHPRAQRRLVQFLLTLSRQKRIQFILSTHSPYVLEELPPEARILLLPGREELQVIYGASTEFALSRIDDRVHPELTLFVEDDESELLLREIIASDPDRGAQILQRIAITPVGPENVVQVLGDLSREDRLPYPSMALVDGDVEPREGTFTLPGDDAPELMVYQDLREADWPLLPERFGIGAGDLFEYLDEAMREPDFHKWSSLVGDRVRKSRSSVWETLATVWVRECLASDDREALVGSIAERLGLH